MKVTRVQCIPVNVPMRKPYVISTGPTNFLEHVIILSHLADGTIGIGEAAPAVVVSEESQGDVMLTIEKFLAPCVLGESVFDLRKYRTG